MIRRIFDFITCNYSNTDIVDISEIIECHTCQYCYDVITCEKTSKGNVNKSLCNAPICYVSKHFQNNYNSINLSRKYTTFIDKNTNKSFIICSYCYNKLKEKTLIKTKGQVYNTFKREEQQYRHINTILEDFGIDNIIPIR